EEQDRVDRAAGDERRAAAVLPAPTDEGDSGRARRRRENRNPGTPETSRRREAAGERAEGRGARDRTARAHDAGVARIPDDPDLLRLAARRAVVYDDGGPPRSGRRAAGARRRSLRSRQSQRSHRRVPRGPEAEGEAEWHHADQGTNPVLRRA